MLRHNRTFGSTSIFAVSLVVGSALMPATVHAQSATDGKPDESLPDIIVTAERRVGNVQKAAASITVRSGDDLLKAGKFSLEAILENVPGITGGAASGTIGTAGTGSDNPAAGLVIRGIPSNAGAGGSTTSTATAAAIYVDGVYSGIGGNFDIDRVEVLRGPQGTLYGRSATAGLVAIHTRNPDFWSIGGSATVEGGNYGLEHYTGVLNLPILTDKLALRVAGNHYNRGGFIDADGGYFRTDNARVKLLFKPSDSLSLLIGAALENNENRNGGRTIGPSPDPEVALFSNSSVGSVKTQFRQYWAEINADLGFASLIYQPAFRSYTQDGELRGNIALGVVSQPLSTPKDEFLTQELRLSSNAESKFIWQVGGTYYRNDLRSRNTTNFNGLTAFDTRETRKTTAFGVYAQATYPVTDTLRVTAGGRYDTSKVEATTIFQLGAFIVGPGPLPPPFILSGEAGKREFNNFTYKLRLEKELAQSNLIYGSVSTGFSPGDVVVSSGCPVSISATPPCPIELEAETLTSFEVGTKNRFLGGALQLNGAIFYSKYAAFQSASINVNPNPGPPEFAPLASPLESYGAEFEAFYRITSADALEINFSSIKSRYVNKPAIFAQFVAETVVTDNGLPGGVAPIPTNASASYQHDFVMPVGGKLALRVEALYTSGYGGHVTAVQKAAGQEPLLRVDSAVVGNVNATWTVNEHIALTGYVRNILDHQYFNKVVLDATGSTYQYQQRYNNPRTYGAILNVKF